MAQNLHKILRNKSFNLFTHENPIRSITPGLLRHPQTTVSEPATKIITNPSPASSTEHKSTHYNGARIYPSFSFGYFLNPISPTGFSDSKPVEDPEPDTDRIIWADSVKKKRKKKMNKHKLKKLKKRLRHCS